MKRFVVVVALILVASAVWAITAPDGQSLQVVIVPAADHAAPEALPNVVTTWYVPDAWRVIEVGKRSWGVVPVNGYPNGVRVQITTSEWTR